jgi:peptidoglycan/LPS O-acetylase OafA/YrhL
MNHTPATAAAARNAYIDLLRGAAILCVLILHFSLSYGIRQSPIGLLPDALVRALALHGNYGVTIFFAVSGYLITRLSLQRWGDLARIDARAFYVMRFARILPPLLPVLAVIVVLGSLGVPSFSNADGGNALPASYFWLGVGSVLTFWHNGLMQSAGYFNYCLNIYWSLSVEEMFYLLMPVLCLSLRRQWMLVVACALLVAAAPVYRAAHSDNEIYYLYGYLACFDAIAMGCLCAMLERAWRPAPGLARALRWGGAVAMAALYVRGYDGIEALGFSMMALCAAVFLMGAAGAAPMAALAARISAPLRWMGRLSYELYLYHIIVLALMRNLLVKADLTAVTRLPLLLLFLALSCLLAALVGRYLAQPVNLALRRRLLKRRSREPRLAAERAQAEHE